MPAATNFTSTGVDFNIENDVATVFDEDAYLKFKLALDTHTHASGLGLGVARVQTSSAPAAAGGVQVTGDAFKWWGATAGAVRTAVDVEGTQTITGAKSFTTKTRIDAAYGTITADADGATITFDLNASDIHSVTLGGNRTLALSNATTGQVFALRLLQDGTGSRTVTWFSTIKWDGGVAPTLTTTASKADIVGFLCTGSGTYDGWVVAQSL